MRKPLMNCPNVKTAYSTENVKLTWSIYLSELNSLNNALEKYFPNLSITGDFCHNLFWENEENPTVLSRHRISSNLFKKVWCTVSLETGIYCHLHHLEITSPDQLLAAMKNHPGRDTLHSTSWIEFREFSGVLCPILKKCEFYVLLFSSCTKLMKNF